jgi:hypothetical protein
MACAPRKEAAMRTNGEAVSLTIGKATVTIGHAYAITATKAEGQPSVIRLWFKPYWPGLMHAMALIVDGRKQSKAKHR